MDKDEYREVEKKLRRFYGKGKGLVSKELEALSRKPGYLTEEAGQLLFFVAKALPRFSNVVEVGAFLGKSTCYIAGALQNKEASFVTIDTFDSRAMSAVSGSTEEFFRENVADYAHLVEVWKMESETASRRFLQEQRGPIDFLWIDGDHSEEGVRKDLESWLPQTAKSAVILMDDYYDKGAKRVKTVVDSLVGEGLLENVGLVSNTVILRPTDFPR